jgi:hypothetical protein
MRLPASTLAASLEERAVDTEAATAQLREALELLELLRGDLERRDELPERARLARQHVLVCDLAYLLDERDLSRVHAEAAIALFERDERQAPLLLARARQARVLDDRQEARRLLEEMLRSGDLVIEAWREKLELWLAALALAEGDHDEARRCVARAVAACERNPRKDRSLVAEAEALLSR